MAELCKPLFLVSLVCVALVVLVELGAQAVLLPEQPNPDVQQAILDEISQLGEPSSKVQVTPGIAVRYLALLDGLLLFTLALVGASLLVPEWVHGRVQGLVTLIGAVVALVVGLALLLAAIGRLLLMVGLLTAVPFGTAAYLATWGAFDRPGAAGTLGLLMALEIGGAVCLVLAHPRFLQNKGLVLLILTSLLANAIVGILHGWVPIFLVSITDAVAAIVVCVLGLGWAVVFALGALVSIVKVLRVRRTARTSA